MDEKVVFRIIQDLTHWSLLPESQSTSMPESKPGIGLVLSPSENHSNEETGFAHGMAAGGPLNGTVSGTSVYTNCTDTDTKLYGDYEKHLEQRFSADFSMSQCRSFASSITGKSFNDLSSSYFLSPTSLHSLALSASHQQLRDFLRLTTGKNNVASVSLGNVVTLLRNLKEPRSDDDVSNGKENNRLKYETQSSILEYAASTLALETDYDTNAKNSATCICKTTSLSLNNNVDKLRTLPASIDSTNFDGRLSASKCIMFTKSWTEIFRGTSNNAHSKRRNDRNNNKPRQSNSSTEHSYTSSSSNRSTPSFTSYRSHSYRSNVGTRFNNSRSSSCKFKSKSVSHDNANEVDQASKSGHGGANVSSNVKQYDGELRELFQNHDAPRVKDLIRLFSEGVDHHLTGRLGDGGKPGPAAKETTSRTTKRTVSEMTLSRKGQEREEQVRYHLKVKQPNHSDAAKQGDFVDEATEGGGKTLYAKDIAFKRTKLARERQSNEPASSTYDDQTEGIASKQIPLPKTFVGASTTTEFGATATNVLSLKAADAFLVSDAMRVITRLLREQLVQVRDDLTRCMEDKRQVEGRLLTVEKMLAQEQQLHAITRRRLAEQDAFAERLGARLARQQQQQQQRMTSSQTCSHCDRQQVDDLIVQSMTRAKHLLGDVTGGRVVVGGDADKSSSSNSDRPPFPPTAPPSMDSH